MRQRFIGLGFSAEFADAYIALLAATVSKPALVTHEVEKILGRPAETFAERGGRPSRTVHQSVKGDKPCRNYVRRATSSR